MSDKTPLLRFKTMSVTLRGTETIIGRSCYCTAVISDPSVSRVHASITQRAGTMFIQDMGSKNGTFLNGSRIGSNPVPLQVGDGVRIGDVGCYIDEADPAGRRETSDHPKLSEDPDQETVRTLVGGRGDEP
jgi:predicted component of type VI protein secretion system